MRSGSSATSSNTGPPVVTHCPTSANLPTMVPENGATVVCLPSSSRSRASSARRRATVASRTATSALRTLECGLRHVVLFDEPFRFGFLTLGIGQLSPRLGQARPSNAHRDLRKLRIQCEQRIALGNRRALFDLHRRNLAIHPWRKPNPPRRHDRPHKRLTARSTSRDSPGHRNGRSIGLRREHAVIRERQNESQREQIDEAGRPAREKVCRLQNMTPS